MRKAVIDGRGEDQVETAQGRGPDERIPDRTQPGEAVAVPLETTPESLLDLVDQAVVVCDASDTVTAHNRPATRLFPRLRAGDHLTAPAAGPLAQALARGTRHFEAAYEGRRLHGHQERSGDGTVWLVRDVTTEQECRGTLAAQQDRSAFLSETTRRLGSSLHYGRTARNLVRVALPLLADTAVLVLPVHGRRTRWYLAGPHGIQTAGQIPAHTLEHLPPIADALSGLKPRAAAVPGRALDELGLTPRLEPEGQALVLGLSGSGLPAGALVLVRDPRRPPWDPPDIELARQFAVRAGSALATSALYSQQAHTTAVVQAELAPDPLPVMDGVRLGAAYRPAFEALNISGDFYRVAAHPDSGVSFCLGDVCGKGTQAAVLAGLVKQSLRVLALAEPDPLRQLHLLNQALLDGENRFTTLVTGHAWPDSDGGLNVMAAGGGHLPPLVLRDDGTVEYIKIEGTLVGVVPDAVFDATRFHLRPGEMLLLYSDGVSEARGGPTGQELFGDERVARELAACRDMPPGAVAERMEILVTQWLAGHPHDDIAVLAVQAPPRSRRVADPDTP